MSKKFRLIALCLCLVMVSLLFTACDGGNSPKTADGDDIVEITIGCWPVMKSGKSIKKNS